MKRAKYFFASIIALIVLAYGFYALNPNKSALVGFAVSRNTENSFTNEFKIHGLEAKINGNIINVYYKVKEMAGKNHELKVYYELYNTNGEVHASGEKNIVLQKNKDFEYSFSFTADKFSDATLLLSISNSQGRSIASIHLTNRSLTGKAIEKIWKKSELFLYFIFFFVFLALLFYSMKAYRKNKEKSVIVRKIHEGRFIKI